MTTGKLRILITGFGPFPGAPYNPTMALVERLFQDRNTEIDLDRTERRLPGHADAARQANRVAVDIGVAAADAADRDRGGLL